MDETNANVSYNGLMDSEEKIKTTSSDDMTGSTTCAAIAANTVGNAGIDLPESMDSINSQTHLFDNKKFVLEHILYEFHMYLWTTKCLLDSEFSNKFFKDKIQNSIINDIVYIAQKVSLRNILCFFYFKPTKNSDIHFTKFHKGTPPNDAPLFNDNFDEYFTEVCGVPYWENSNKSIKRILDTIISHLTDVRFNWSNIEDCYEHTLSQPKIQAGIYKSVNKAIKKFLDTIQEN